MRQNHIEPPLGDTRTQTEGEGLGAHRTAAWATGHSPGATFPALLTPGQAGTPFFLDPRPHVLPGKHGAHGVPCPQSPSLPAQGQRPTCPLLPAFPRPPSKATRRAPTTLSHSPQHKGLPRDPL